MNSITQQLPTIDFASFRETENILFKVFSDFEKKYMFI